MKDEILYITEGCTYYVNNKKHKIDKSLKIKHKIAYNQVTLDNLYKNAAYLFPILNKYKIEYFVVGGTLLGALRHNGIIPWDIDIDIAISKKSYYKLIALIKELNSINPDYKWIDVRQPGLRIYYKKYAKVDLFVVDEFSNDKNMFAYSAPYINNKPLFHCYKYCFPKIKFERKIAFPVKKHKFEDMMIYIPNKPEQFLFLNYNKKCLKEIIGPNKDHYNNVHNTIWDKEEFSEFYKWGNSEMLKKHKNSYNLMTKICKNKFSKAFNHYGVEMNSEPEEDLNLVGLIKESPCIISKFTSSVYKNIILPKIKYGN